MVSNALDLELEQLLATLERLRLEFGTDPDYVKLRRDLPAAWPL